ncbi:protein lin-7 homolog B isoform X2 [Homo sapiens]|uniref:protein lin-7 homolog B isoform X2 n=1 Tax=Homo sapiens TaxID=9606 RepID=UPI0007DC58E5|nr:protein lin-7 homolog B isoform X2 [Homo sapiens]XP_054177717.1 protein lin-7 homolog B isoform X2 [Homo sapiens]|eukprot:XP_016882620.1 protein lin-7 homolog B isoform X2 [Homo sapiens]
MAALVEPLGLERDVSRAVELLERLQRSGELPPQKLQALQRVLQSRFCSAIREGWRSWRLPDAAASSPRCMSSFMTRWTSPAAPRSEPMPQPRALRVSSMRRRWSC